MLLFSKSNKKRRIFIQSSKPGFLEKPILDSRLITGVRFEKYNYKIIKCGKYIQVYHYAVSRFNSSLEQLDFDALHKSKKGRARVGSLSTEKKIENKNIIRAKLNCQRLAKANVDSWKSFITLTYKENMQDVAQAKLDFSYFVKNIRKVKKDFKYIVIPEFQKRGAIHFHFLSNLSLEDKDIIIKQKDNDKYYDVKYWSKGFSSFENVVGDCKKIVGYISKYMTKDDVDERLFNFRRFSSSQNLNKPIVEYVDLKNQHARSELFKLIQNSELIYTDTYLDAYENEVKFYELCG